MGELKVIELMRKMEILVGHKSSTAIQAGYVDVDYSGKGEVTLSNLDGTTDSVYHHCFICSHPC